MASPPRGEQTIVQTIAGRRTVARASSAPDIPRATVTPGVVNDPVRLQRHLTDLQQQLDAVHGVVQSLAFGSGVLIKGISFVAGVSKLVEHRLGRNVQGWIVTDNLSVTTVYPVIVRLALPTGRSSNQWIYLEASRDCTADVYIF